MDNNKIGKFIAERRKELGYNQKDLAEKLNVTDKAVSKWETGRSSPDVSLLIPLAKILGVSVTEILNGEKISEDLFIKNEVGYYAFNFNTYSLLSEGKWYRNYAWKQEFIDESTGELIPEKVLAKLAACCGKKEIDFSLEWLLDDPDYGELYTTLKNEEAIKFLDTIKNRDLLRQLLCNGVDLIDQFLKNTCFVKGTTKPAYNGNGNNDINYWNLGKFTLYEKSLYAVDTNSNKLYLFVDSEGNAVGEEIVPDYADPIRISSTLVKPEGIYIKNANVNNIGDEIGSHTVLRFDPKTNAFENMFYEMPNNKTYEVISYTVGGDNLYCCLSKGTEIKTIKIDITTKQFTEIASGTKLSQIIIVK
jgi:transcriptional regulator with XRE-family HTH domain